MTGIVNRKEADAALCRRPRKVKWQSNNRLNTCERISILREKAAKILSRVSLNEKGVEIGLQEGRYWYKTVSQFWPHHFRNMVGSGVPDRVAIMISGRGTML